ncbi:hypothetical protein WJX73_008777 [Symbiochloris irregularis]|uniref:HIT-type domain-containing protein n=1 Tax=Symbiochloris irregularis TaxID=706552 RepID=A0AAW1PEC9_9CHLO
MSTALSRVNRNSRNYRHRSGSAQISDMSGFNASSSRCGLGDNVEMIPGQARLCKVCTHNSARYSCPQCNTPYCSLQCYKQHGERCTEAFYRTQAVDELKGTTATPDDRARMLQVLQRLHDEDNASDTSGSTDSDDSGEDTAGPLQQELLQKLQLKDSQGVNGSAHRDDEAALNMRPEDWAAFEAAVAKGTLNNLIAPWQPWWMTQEAADLRLNEQGQRMVQGSSMESTSMNARRL